MAKMEIFKMVFDRASQDNVGRLGWNVYKFHLANGDPISITLYDLDKYKDKLKYGKTYKLVLEETQR